MALLFCGGPSITFHVFQLSVKDEMMKGRKNGVQVVIYLYSTANMRQECAACMEYQVHHLLYFLKDMNTHLMFSWLKKLNSPSGPPVVQLVLFTRLFVCNLN